MKCTNFPKNIFLKIKGENENVERKGSVIRQYLAAGTINLMLLSSGCVDGWISPTLLKLQGHDSPSGEPLSDEVCSWMVSGLAIGAIVSTPILGYMADAYGRKISLLSLALPCTLSWLLMLCSASGWSLILGRTLAGMTIGGAYILNPIYVAEISDPSCRGALGIMLSLENSMGCLLGYLVGGLLSYRASVGVFLGIPVVYALVFSQMPETPVYLVKRGKIEEAAKSLAWFKSLEPTDSVILTELQKLQDDDALDKTVPKLTFKNVVQNRGNRRGLGIILILLSIEGLSGFYAVMHYVGIIFAAALDNAAAVDESRPFERMLLSNTGSSVFVGLVMVLGSLAGFYLVEKCGRKFLLIGSCGPIAVFLAALGVWFYLKEYYPEVPLPSWLPMVALSVCVFGNAAGIYAVPWVIISEVFTFQVRSALSVPVLIWGWVLGFLQLKVFTPLTLAIGFHGLLWVFTFVNVFGVFYTIFFIPETKGRTLDEINKELGYDKNETEENDKEFASTNL